MQCCAVMLDPRQAVCMTPQAFHNAIKPDFFDNQNKYFAYGALPYKFGAGCCFITGARPRSAQNTHVCRSLCRKQRTLPPVLSLLPACQE